MATRDALPLEVASPAVVLGFHHEAQRVYQPNKFQQSQTTRGRAVDNSTHFMGEFTVPCFSPQFSGGE